MRSKIKVDGKFYKPMPWLKNGDCDGCNLGGEYTNCCYNTNENGTPCDEGNEFDGYIFVRMNKESVARYVMSRLEKAS